MSIVFVAEGFLSRVKDAANVVPIVSFMHSLRVSNTLSLIKHVSITDGLLLNFPIFQYSDLQISKCFKYSDFRIFKFSDTQIFRLPDIVIFSFLSSPIFIKLKLRCEENESFIEIPGTSNFQRLGYQVIMTRKNLFKVGETSRNFTLLANGYKLDNFVLNIKRQRTRISHGSIIFKYLGSLSPTIFIIQFRNNLSINATRRDFADRQCYFDSFIMVPVTIMSK